MLALTTAAELPRVPLPEALAICLLLLDKEPARFEAARGFSTGGLRPDAPAP
jgi:hypothetical protein